MTRPEQFPTATREGERWIGEDGTRYWAHASGERFIWTNRPPGWKFPESSAIYDVMGMYEVPLRSGQAAA